MRIRSTPRLDRRSLLARATALAAIAGPAAAWAEVGEAARIDAAWRDALQPHAMASRAWLSRLSQAAADGPFSPDWGSLQAWRAPQWYQDARFGVFVHWGVYAVPAFGSEWYARQMYQPGTAEFAHHVATYGPQDRFGYKDFIPRFTAPRFDPKAWARLFREAGARYVVPVAEHHDGFAMYDSALSDWTAAKMGPRRDVLGELKAALVAEGLRFGLSSHRAEHDWFFDGGRTFASDVRNPRYAALYGPAQARMAGKEDTDLMGDFTYVSPAWLDDWSARTAELVTTYAPDLVYFDWWVGHPAFRTSLPRFLAAYYNATAAKGEAGVVNYKLGEFALGSGVLDIERGQAPSIQADVWQTCTSISRKSWGYVEGDDYKPPRELVHTLVDVASKNGNLLLNVGPRPDGTIPEGAQSTFRAIGGWLKANGEAIYASRTWRVFGEGPTDAAAGSFSEAHPPAFTERDVRFTTRDGRLYAILLGWPRDGEALLTAVRPSDGFVRAELVADGRPVPMRQTAEGLRLSLPSAPVGDFAYAIRLERA